jgi:hypothetical protein
MSLASNALTTITNCETLLSLTAGAQDALLEMLINSVSDSIQRYCGRKFAKQVHAQKYAGYDRQRLYMDEWPILEQSTYPTVTVDDSAYTSGDDEDYQIFSGEGEGENYLYRESTWTATLYNRSGRTLADAGPVLVGDDIDSQREEKNINVTLLAGYVLPGFVSRVVTGPITAGTSKVITVANTTCLAKGDTVTITSTGSGETPTPVTPAATESCTISAAPTSTTVTLATVVNNHAGTITMTVTRTLPYDLEEATIHLVGLKMTQRTNRGIISEKTPGGYQVQYEKATDLGAIPADIKAVLDRYRRFAVWG